MEIIEVGSLVVGIGQLFKWAIKQMGSKSSKVSKSEFDRVSKELNELKAEAQRNPERDYYNEVINKLKFEYKYAYQWTNNNDYDNVILVMGAKGAGKTTFLFHECKLGPEPSEHLTDGTTEIHFHDYYDNDRKMCLIDTIGCHPTVANIMKVIAVTIVEGRVPDTLLIVDQSRPGQYEIVTSWTKFSCINLLSFSTDLFYDEDVNKTVFQCVRRKKAEEVNRTFNGVRAITCFGDIRRGNFQRRIHNLLSERDDMLEFKRLPYSDYVSAMTTNSRYVGAYDSIFLFFIGMYCKMYCDSGKDFNDLINSVR